MKRKRIIINAEQPNEFRVAFLEDGKLVDFELESAHHNPVTGNIYVGVVTAVKADLESAFVDFGEERHGLLPFNRLGGPGPRTPRPQFTDSANSAQPVDLQVDQKLLVQVFREARGEKGAALTREFSLPGRYIVLKPNTEIRTVTRNVSEENRNRLRSLANKLPQMDNIGWIIRTTAVDHDYEDVVSDFHRLLNLWRKIESEFEKTTSHATKLMYSDNTFMQRVLRDRFRNDGTEVIVDDPVVYRESRDFASELMPELRDQIQLYQGDRPIFEKFRVEKDVGDIFSRKVSLPSGGELVFDPTEALLSIDVNSAKNTSRDNLEDTALHTNLEAAAEICRQLKIRNIGGLIVVDFIDMPTEGHNEQVEEVVRECLAKDPINAELSAISEFGLMQLSRQRRGFSIYDTHFKICEHCQGGGYVPRLEGNANRVLRQLSYVTHDPRKAENQFICRVPSEVASLILNRERKYLRHLETNTRKQILIIADPELNNSNFEIEEKRVRNLDFELGSNLEEEVAEQHRELKSRAKTAVPDEPKGKDVPVVSPLAVSKSKKRAKQQEAKSQTDKKPRTAKKKSGNKKHAKNKQGAIGRFFSSIFGSSDSKSKKQGKKRSSRPQPKRANAQGSRTTTHTSNRRPSQNVRGGDANQRNPRGQAPAPRRAAQPQRSGPNQGNERTNTRRSANSRRRTPSEGRSNQPRGQDNAGRRGSDVRQDSENPDQNRRAPRSSRSGPPRAERGERRDRGDPRQQRPSNQSRGRQSQPRQSRQPNPDRIAGNESATDAPAPNMRAPVASRRMPQANRGQASAPSADANEQRQQRPNPQTRPQPQAQEGERRVQEPVDQSSEKVTVSTQRPPQRRAEPQPERASPEKARAPREPTQAPTSAPSAATESAGQRVRARPSVQNSETNEDRPTAAQQQVASNPAPEQSSPEQPSGDQGGPSRAGNDPRHRGE